MANEAGYQELIKLAKDLGYYGHPDVIRDLEIDWEHTLSRENAPMSYGFGLAHNMFHFFLQGDLGHILSIDSFRKEGYPSEDYKLYLKREGEPIVEVLPTELYLWLCETLDTEYYLAQAKHAQDVWEQYRDRRIPPPPGWSDIPKYHAESRWYRYTWALDARDQASYLKDALEKGRN